VGAVTGNDSDNDSTFSGWAFMRDLRIGMGWLLGELDFRDDKGGGASKIPRILLGLKAHRMGRWGPSSPDDGSALRIEQLLRKARK
jgi:hypothetical protein